MGAGRRAAGRGIEAAGEQGSSAPDEAIYEVECASGYLPAGDGVAAAQRRAVLAAADLLRKHRPAA